jgi:hypothetical protein
MARACQRGGNPPSLRRGKPVEVSQQNGYGLEVYRMSTLGSSGGGDQAANSDVARKLQARSAENYLAGQIISLLVASISHCETGREKSVA